VGPGVQDFGARDATPGEKESNFSEKALYHYDTDHLTMCVPQLTSPVAMTLAARRNLVCLCTACNNVAMLLAF
jgi:hypothetical protein